MTTALQVGFRHLDCAERYSNEREIGEAIREALHSGAIRRPDLFVTTKLWDNNHRPERVAPALRASLERLGLDYVDLFDVSTPRLDGPLTRASGGGVGGRPTPPRGRPRSCRLGLV
jgi:alcohol dehydrogenase (NADP+)